MTAQLSMAPVTKAGALLTRTLFSKLGLVTSSARHRGSGVVMGGRVPAVHEKTRLSTLAWLVVPPTAEI